MATISGERPDASNPAALLKKGVAKTPRRNFLWWCAGAHQQLLADSPSEGIKYAGLGGVLLSTFALAALSAGYAVHSVFGNPLWTVLFAGVWGLIIFNFDRLLVSTMRKWGIPFRRQLLLALPRVLLALLIGLTIARPLELKVFEKEIEVKMAENLRRKVQRNDSLLQLEAGPFVMAAEAERQRLVNRRQILEDSLSTLQSAYVQEADGTGGSGRRGIDRLTRLKMEAYQSALARLTPEIGELNKSIAAQDSIIAATRGDLVSRRGRYEQLASANLGFLERNKALSDLAEEESSVWWTNLMISLLIILVEVGPILSKLIMPVGPYDLALAREEQLLMAAEESRILKGKEIILQKRKAVFEKQQETSANLVEKVAGLQQKYIDKDLAQWEEGSWQPDRGKADLEEVVRSIKKQYGVDEDAFL